MVGLVNYAMEPHSVELRELPVPGIGEEDVLFKVQAVGICGSDLHQYTGKQSWKVNYPVVLGHEFAGYVAKVGGRVDGFKEGDRVVSETAALLLTVRANEGMCLTPVRREGIQDTRLSPEGNAGCVFAGS
jgi:L-iditol 2-dehydrogenase